LPFAYLCRPNDVLLFTVLGVLSLAVLLLDLAALPLDLFFFPPLVFLLGFESDIGLSWIGTVRF